MVKFEYSFAFIVFPGIYPNFDISWQDILRTLRPLDNFSYSANIRGSQGDIDWTCRINYVVMMTL